MYDVQRRRPGHGRVVADAGRHVARRLVVFLFVLVIAARVPPVHAPIAQPRPRQQASRFLRTKREFVNVCVFAHEVRSTSLGRLTLAAVPGTRFYKHFIRKIVSGVLSVRTLISLETLHNKYNQTNESERVVFGRYVSFLSLQSYLNTYLYYINIKLRNLAEIKKKKIIPFTGIATP